MTRVIVVLHRYIALSVTINSFIVKTCNMALHTFPFNVSFWQSLFGQDSVYCITLALLFHHNPTKRSSLRKEEELRNTKLSKGEFLE